MVNVVSGGRLVDHVKTLAWVEAIEVVPTLSWRGDYATALSHCLISTQVITPPL